MNDDSQKKEEAIDLEAMLKEAEQSAAAQEEATQAETQAQGSTQAKIDELTAALARCMADLSNFKRRTDEERVRWMHVATVDLLKSLLVIFDNFDRCSQHLPESLKTNDWAKGVIQVHDDLMKTLNKLGVQKIPTVGEKVDPNRHEAMLKVPGEANVIVAEFEAGYLYKDTVIKPARVSVGDGNPPSS